MSGGVLGIAAFGLVLGSFVLWSQRMRSVRIPRNRGGFVAAMTAGVLLSIAALRGDPGLLGGVLAGLALLGGALFLVLFAISRQKGDSGRFRIGEPLPEFSAPDDSGAVFRVSSGGGRPLLLKFFRGHW
jgi:hypothetical protein